MAAAGSKPSGPFTHRIVTYVLPQDWELLKRHHPENRGLVKNTESVDFFYRVARSFQSLWAQKFADTMDSNIHGLMKFSERTHMGCRNNTLWENLADWAQVLFIFHGTFRNSNLLLGKGFEHTAEEISKILIKSGLPRDKGLQLVFFACHSYKAAKAVSQSLYRENYENKVVSGYHGTINITPSKVYISLGDFIVEKTGLAMQHYSNGSCLEEEGEETFARELAMRKPPEEILLTDIPKIHPGLVCPVALRPSIVDAAEDKAAADEVVAIMGTSAAANKTSGAPESSPTGVTNQLEYHTPLPSPLPFIEEAIEAGRREKPQALLRAVIAGFSKAPESPAPSVVPH